jgi:hypothetical protein
MSTRSLKPVPTYHPLLRDFHFDFILTVIVPAIWVTRNPSIDSRLLYPFPARLANKFANKS